MTFAVKINGKTHNIDIDGDTPLLWVSRDMLAMTGTKFCCGKALRETRTVYTVYVDSVATRSRVTPINGIGDSDITTIEPIGATVPGARIRLGEEVIQRGFGQSRQIMSASELLARNPRPTDADIHDAMNGNICRRGTCFRVRDARSGGPES